MTQTEVPMMYVILSTMSSDEYDNAECDHALLKLDEERCLRMLRQMDLAARLACEDKELAHVAFDAEVWFFAHDDDLEGLDLDKGDDEPRVLGEDPEIDDLVQRTECDVMVVHPSLDQVEFQAHPRHGDQLITTAPLRRQKLEEIVGLLRREVSSAPPTEQGPAV